jgi:hypothetical protein
LALFQEELAFVGALGATTLDLLVVRRTLADKRGSALGTAQFHTRHTRLMVLSSAALGTQARPSHSKAARSAALTHTTSSTATRTLAPSATSPSTLHVILPSRETSAVAAVSVVGVIPAAAASAAGLVMTAVVEPLVVARLARGLERPREIAFDHQVRILSPHSEHHLDAVLGKDPDRPWTHASGKDHLRTDLSQPHGKHSPTVLGRAHHLPRVDRFRPVGDRVQCERIGATEVLAEPPITYRNRDCRHLLLLRS